MMDARPLSSAERSCVVENPPTSSASASQSKKGFNAAPRAVRTEYLRTPGPCPAAAQYIPGKPGLFVQPCGVQTMTVLPPTKTKTGVVRASAPAARRPLDKCSSNGTAASMKLAATTNGRAAGEDGHRRISVVQVLQVGDVY